MPNNEDLYPCNFADDTDLYPDPPDELLGAEPDEVIEWMQSHKMNDVYYDIEYQNHERHDGPLEFDLL